MLARAGCTVKVYKRPCSSGRWSWSDHPAWQQAGVGTVPANLVTLRRGKDESEGTMPRDLPLGNGRLLLAFDHTYTLRDLYYPHVGQENHTQGQLCRFGVWVDHQLVWLHDDGWERQLRYQPDTLVSNVLLHHPALGLQLQIRDAVDIEDDAWIREVCVRDLTGRDRTVRLFSHFDGYLWGYADGETAYYEPVERAIVHYKGKRYFWFSGWAGTTPGLHTFATGNKGFRGREGTWRDAEDGYLSQNPIAQGSVDSIIGLELAIPAHDEARAYFWMAAGLRHADVRRIHERIVDQHPATILRRVERYWQGWVNHRRWESRLLSPRALQLLRQSLLILRTQIDEHGAIVAANDSDILQFGRDTYSYVWPRDGALIAIALDKAGYPELSRRFFLFIHELVTKYGFFLHKYNPDGSAGSSWHPWATSDGQLQFPIQEDSTALVLYALWEHYQRTHDVELIRQLYLPMVVPCARFLATYRDEHTGLPKPSYDLWEERHGIHAFTVAAVWAGLVAAANFARMFADDDLAEEWEQAATSIRAATLHAFYDPTLGRFVRTVHVDGPDQIRRDPTLDASLAGLFAFGLISPHDPHLEQTMEAIAGRLWCQTPVGGIARYENDYYYQMSHDIERVPGNPWFICTLWLADWYIARAMSPAYLYRAQELIEWVVEHALPSGVLAEQVHPYTGQPLSVSPLSWSHGTFIATVLDFLAREQQLIETGWGALLG